MMKEDLNKRVFVTGQGQAAWDGKEYDLSQGVEVALGVANRWIDIGYTLTISEARTKEIPPRDIVNPLDSESQGEAFQALKRGRKPKEG